MYQQTNAIADALTLFEAWIDGDHETSGIIARKYEGAEGILVAHLVAAGGYLLEAVEAGRSVKDIVRVLHAGQLPAER